MKRIREKRELNDLEGKRRDEETAARKDWAKKVKTLEYMLMRRKYEEDVKRQNERKAKLEEEIDRHSSKTSFSDFYHLEDHDPQVEIFDPEPAKPYMLPTTNQTPKAKRKGSVRTKNMMCNRPPIPKVNKMRYHSKSRKVVLNRDITLNQTYNHSPRHPHVITNIKIDTQGNPRLTSKLGKSAKITVRSSRKSTLNSNVRSPHNATEVQGKRIKSKEKDASLYVKGAYMIYGINQRKCKCGDSARSFTECFANTHKSAHAWPGSTTI